MNTRPDRRYARKIDADHRAIVRQEQDADDQLSRLDARFGVGVGAVRKRARLQLLLTPKQAARRNGEVR